MSDHSDLVAQLRAQGHRLTPQRRLVLEVLLHSDHHLRADEIGQAIAERYPALNVDHSTIYRTLRWLRENGLVSETSLGQGHMVYAMATHHNHHHLVCENCQSVIEIEPEVMEDVRREIEQRYGFRPRLDHMSIFGLCARCQG